MEYEKLTGYVPEENTSEEEESNPNITHGTRLWALISIILSAVGIILVFVPAVGIFFGAAGVAFALVSRFKNGYFYSLAVTGLILSVVALASSGFFIVYNAFTDAGLITNLFDGLLK